MSKYGYLTAGKMKVFSLGLLILSVLAVNAHAQSIDGFAVLGATTVTNVPTSTISGSVGTWPNGSATAITGFNSSPGVAVSDPQVTGGTVQAGTAAAHTAQADALAEYNSLAGAATTSNLTGADLGSVGVLTPGVYTFSSSAGLTGALTLNFEGLTNQNIVFQIGSTLTTASNSSVLIENAGTGDNVDWQVGSSATLGTGTSFAGTIIADTSVTMTTGATDGCGSVIALNGAVTLDTNTISTGCTINSGSTPVPVGPGGTTVTLATVPEGGSPLLYLCFFLVPVGAMRAFRFRRSI